MASVTTVDITPFNGGGKFPVNDNDVYKIVETIAVQHIAGLKSTNRVIDGFKEYKIDGNGAVIEEARVEMATRQDFTKTGTPDLSPKDPKVAIRYFNNWETSQFKTTIRRSDIRKVIADKGAGLDEVIAQILESLTEGEGYHDCSKMVTALGTAGNQLKNISAVDQRFTGKHAKSIKGLIYLIREAYNMIKSTNNVGLDTAVVGTTYVYGVDPKDIRIAISESVLNLIDVTELANVFNLSKEELFGKLVIVPHIAGSALSMFARGFVMVYDVNAMGYATRMYEYSQDNLGVGLYSNHYLSTEKCYFYNPLCKGLAINGSVAVNGAIGELLEADAS